MARYIRSRIGTRILLDEGITELDIRRKLPLFFQKVPARRYETFDVYRGFLIVRHTQKFSERAGGGSQRWVIIYAVNTSKCWDTFISLHTTVKWSLKECRELIDEMIKRRKLCEGDASFPDKMKV